MPQQFLSQAGALKLAQQRQTYLVNSVIHLFQQNELFNPTPATPLADYLTYEATFDGYLAKILATWPTIVAAAGTSFLVFAATQTWIWEFDTEGIGNMIAGHFIVSAAGDLIDVVKYDTPIAMQGELQSVVQTPSELAAN